MAAVLAAAAEEQPAEVLAAARQGQGAAARSSTSVAALDITRARADDLQRLALGLAALLYTRVTYVASRRQWVGVSEWWLVRYCSLVAIEVQPAMH